MAASTTNFNYGYPTPGPQHPTAQKVLDHVFFLSEEEFKNAREIGVFDYIVIGSGFCSFAFVERAIDDLKKKDIKAKILVIEKGTFFLPMHFQNLAPIYVKTLGGLSETFPWTLSKTTVHSTSDEHFITWNHGMVPFFGGRSFLWSAWCPTPTDDEMEHWPQHTKKIMIDNGEESYVHSAKKLLNVRDDPTVSPNLAVSHVSPYAAVHKHALAVLQEAVVAHKVEGANRVIAAPLAIGNDSNVDFAKFSVPAPFLQLISDDAEENDQTKNKNIPYLSVACNVDAQRLLVQDNTVTAIQTSRGIIPVGDAKVIVANGAIPAATLLMNSFPEKKNIGAKFSAHFITSIVARIKRTDFFAAKTSSDLPALKDLELGAVYLAGHNLQNKFTYHLQISVLSVDDPIKSGQRALRHMPDVVATASTQQLAACAGKDGGKSEWVIFVLACLGEIDVNNPRNKLDRTPFDSDPTTNVTLNIHANANDNATWETMDKAALDTLKAFAGGDESKVEYWHNTAPATAIKAGDGEFTSQPPSRKEMRVNSLVHESSTVHMGEASDDSAPVDCSDYKLKGTNNVYVTGAGLWPTGASWNPTMMMCGMAQNLADILTARQPVKEKPLTALPESESKCIGGHC